jgi:hypothetical protein
MKERPNGGTDDEAASKLKRLFGIPAPGARPMSLEGREALELYLAKINHNTSELKTQAALLHAALRERVELLRELQPAQQDDKKSSSR